MSIVVRVIMLFMTIQSQHTPTTASGGKSKSLKWKRYEPRIEEKPGHWKMYVKFKSREQHDGNPGDVTFPDSPGKRYIFTDSEKPKIVMCKVHSIVGTGKNKNDAVQ